MPQTLHGGGYGGFGFDADLLQHPGYLVGAEGYLQGAEHPLTLRSQGSALLRM